MSANKFTVLMDDDNWEVVTKKKKKKPEIVRLPVKKPEPKKIEKKANIRHILCKNIFGDKGCEYRKTCLYAHTLHEQKINNDRQELISVLRDRTKLLDDINLNTNTDFLNTALVYSKLCSKCKDNNCVGGYNCKNGSPIEKLVICIVDFQTGLCTNNECKKIHLTERGLIPYEKQVSDVEVKKEVMCGTRKYNDGLDNKNEDLPKQIVITKEVVTKVSRNYVDPIDKIETLRIHYDVDDEW